MRLRRLVVLPSPPSLAGCPLTIDESLLEERIASRDGGASTSDGGDGSDGGGDAGAICDKAQPFGAPVLLGAPVNTPAPEFGGRFSFDERTLYFYRNVGSPQDLYEASREGDALRFSAPKLLAGIAEADSNETHFTVSRDGTLAFFSSNRPGSEGRDVWVARRPGATGAWQTPERVAALASAMNDTDTFLRPDGKVLYFASARSGGGDLFQATVDDVGSGVPDVGAPVALAALNTADEEQAPMVTADDLTIYFSRTPAGRGDSDIFVATRATAKLTFGDVTPVAELSTDFIERPTWISPDGCRMLLTSSRPGTLGESDLFLAEKGRAP